MALVGLASVGHDEESAKPLHEKEQGHVKRVLCTFGLIACSLVLLVTPASAATARVTNSSWVSTAVVQPPPRDDFPDSIQCWYHPRQGQYQCGYTYLDGRTTRWYSFWVRHDPPDWSGGVDFPDYYSCRNERANQYRCGFWGSSDGRTWREISWWWAYDPPNWWGGRP